MIMPLVNAFLNTPFNFSRTRERKIHHAELDIAAFLSVGPQVAEQVGGWMSRTRTLLWRCSLRFLVAPFCRRHVELCSYMYVLLFGRNVCSYLVARVRYLGAF